jgi:MraZ protein
VFGRTTHQLDPKGRVFIPKRLQGQLPADGDGVRSGILIRGMDNSLALLSQEAFDAEVAKLDTSVFAEEDGLLFQRLFFAYAFPVSLDKNGRLQIPKELREVAELESEPEVSLIGLRDRIEIWASSRWTESVDAKKDAYDRLAKLAARRAHQAAIGGENGGGQ